jgi:hypothetical protein
MTLRVFLTSSTSWSMKVSLGRTSRRVRNVLKTSTAFQPSVIIMYDMAAAHDRDTPIWGRFYTSVSREFFFL